MKVPSIKAVQMQMSQSANAIGKIAPSKRLENITKVTFETASGKTFTFFNARVWKLNFRGNLAYQIRGDYPDLEEMLKEEVKKNDVV